MGGEPDGNAGESQVDIGVVVGGVGQLADRPQQGDAGRERPGLEVRGRVTGAPQRTPVPDSSRRVKLLRSDPFGHALNIPIKPSPTLAG